MTGIDFYIYTVISLLGVAYPLLLQVVARLDEKYSSSKIVAMFDKECEGKVFKLLLHISLISIIVWTLQLPPLLRIKRLDFYIDNSTAIAIFSSTTVLIVFFLLYVKKILIYYKPEELVKYLKRKHTKRSDEDDFKYFEALSDILFFSIRTQQKNLSISLSEFFNQAFKAEREKYKDKKTVYPDSYYEVVHKAIEELAILKEKRNYGLEYQTSSGIWLLGYSKTNRISERTYFEIWRNLLLIVHYGHEDMIFNHWKYAHQYFNRSLYQIYSIPDEFIHAFGTKNREEVKQREEDRFQFIEFHFALGSLLLYSKMYELIDRVFSHTQTHPPQYVLLPERMDEIFGFYYLLRSSYDEKYVWISSRYPFPNLSGISADFVVRKWISSYMALLFLRQYTIYPYLMTMKPLEYPSIPKTQSEISNWIEELDFFKELVEEHLSNQQLLETLDMDFITRHWCKVNNKPYPTDFIDNFKVMLEDAKEYNSINLSVSTDKEKLFENSTKKIIEETISSYSKINNTNTISGEVDVFLIDGHNIIFSKDAFLENSEVTHADYDSVLAEAVSTKITNKVAATFIEKRSRRYLLQSEDIFDAIDKLNVDEQYVIICFGVYLDYFINQLKVKGLSADKYKGIEIINYSDNNFIGSSFFILKRNDLPSFTTKEIDALIRDKYNTNKISDNLELYASVIDLNNASSEIIDRHRYNMTDDEIRKHVLLNVFISFEIKWKKRVEMIQIVQYSGYKQQGICDSIKDVDPIN